MSGRRGRVEPLNPQLPLLSGHEVRSLHVSPKGYLVVALVDGLLVSRFDKDCRLSSPQFLMFIISVRSCPSSTGVSSVRRRCKR